ncbi:MAG: hypothetical protein J5879_05210 [Clostridia bacterium]|nr:hypothetical protein [Clostridia bacterium]
MKEELYGGYEWCRPYLDAGEYVKWTGSPEKKRRIHPLYLFLIPFFVFWIGAVALGTAAAISSVIDGEGDMFSVVFMIPFWVAGAVMVFFVFIYPAVSRSRTVYAVTNKKVIQKYGKRIKMINLVPLPQVYLSETDRHGYGSVTVGTPDARYRGEEGYFPWAGSGCIVISGISDPYRIYRLITAEGR